MIVQYVLVHRQRIVEFLIKSDAHRQNVSIGFEIGIFSDHLQKSMNKTN